MSGLKWIHVSKGALVRFIQIKDETYPIMTYLWINDVLFYIIIAILFLYYIKHNVKEYIRFAVIKSDPQIMSYLLFSAKLISEPMLAYCQME